jgi:hypothetical protein
MLEHESPKNDIWLITVKEACRATNCARLHDCIDEYLYKDYNLFYKKVRSIS